MCLQSIFVSKVFSVCLVVTSPSTSWQRSCWHDLTTATLCLPVCRTTVAPLQRVINTATQLVCGLRLRYHVISRTPPLSCTGCWSTHGYSTSCVWSFIEHWMARRQTMSPSYLQPVTTTSTRHSSLRSANKNTLLVPRRPTSLKFGEQAFSVAGPAAWKSLPTDIRTISISSVFKKKVKTFLFTKYYQTSWHVSGLVIFCNKLLLSVIIIIIIISQKLICGSLYNL